MIFRDAVESDLPDIVRLLSDDHLSGGRETPDDPAYAKALASISAQSTTRFLVAELDGAVIGCLQLNIFPALARRGMTRAIIDSVRIDAQLRGRGYGDAFMQEAIRLAKAGGAGVIELSSLASRKAAHRFYERLGFQGSHLGMKRML